MARTKGALTPKRKFEIFARDNFTCLYCGRRPPEVALEVDHYWPASKTPPRIDPNRDYNLRTSCFDCNRSKGDRPLTKPRYRLDPDYGEIRNSEEALFVLNDMCQYIGGHPQLVALVRDSVEEIRKVLETAGLLEASRG